MGAEGVIRIAAWEGCPSIFFVAVHTAASYFAVLSGRLVGRVHRLLQGALREDGVWTQ